MERNRPVLIALISMTLLAVELIWTRIFSAEFFFTFAFLVLSLAVLGIGVGALASSLFPSLGRRHVEPIVLCLGGLSALAGPPAVLRLGLEFSKVASDPAMTARLAAAIAILSSTFFFGGIVLASIFKRGHEQMPRLYMADLLGAGIGVILSILMMNQVGTLETTFLAAVPMLLAAFMLSRRWMRLVPLALGVGVVFACVYAEPLLAVPRPQRAPVIYTHWDAMSKVKIYEFNEYQRGIEIDNAANSPVLAFDGDFERSDDEKIDFDFDVSYLIDQFEDCTFLSLGAGGGCDVLQALQAGAKEVHAVEINPHINELMLHGDLAEFSGNLYNDPRVVVATEDARAYVARHKNKFDVIFSLSSNSFAALTSGSFALAENYLFTTEAFEDYWEAMTDDGFMMMEHQFFMPRLVSSAIDALTALGVEDPRSHIAVYSLPRLRRQAIVLSKRPLTDEIRNHAIGEIRPEFEEYRHLAYPADEKHQDNPVNRIVQEGWRAVAPSCKVNISPSTDNRPFVGQMGLWRNFDWDKLDRLSMLGVGGFPLAQVIIVVILLVVGVLVLPLMLLPYVRRGERLRAAPFAYFFLIGVAYMAVEVVLIQKYRLFVGPSVYSISTILLSLLIGSGIGSRFAARVSDRTAFLGIIVWLLLDVFAFTHLTYALDGWTLMPRMATTVLLVFPLGFFMGMPFPKGALRVGSLVDWGFAVNGAASVIGATGILLVAMNYGIRLSLLTGAGLYLLAFGLMRLDGAWRTRRGFDEARVDDEPGSAVLDDTPMI